MLIAGATIPNMRVKQSSAHNTSIQSVSSARSLSLLRSKRQETSTRSDPSPKKVKKVRKAKPGKKVIKEIRKYQLSTDLLLRNLPFQRLVREITHEYSILTANGRPFLWKRNALQALQCAAEYYITALFEDVNKAALHAKRVTIRPDDLGLVRSIRSSVNEHEIL